MVIEPEKFELLRKKFELRVKSMLICAAILQKKFYQRMNASMDPYGYQLDGNPVWDHVEHIAMYRTTLHPFASQRPSELKPSNNQLSAFAINPALPIQRTKVPDHNKVIRNCQ